MSAAGGGGGLRQRRFIVSGAISQPFSYPRSSHLLPAQKSAKSDSHYQSPSSNSPLPTSHPEHPPTTPGPRPEAETAGPYSVTALARLSGCAGRNGVPGEEGEGLEVRIKESKEALKCK